MTLVKTIMDPPLSDIHILLCKLFIRQIIQFVKVISQV